jgi:hypothetical protein
MKDFFEYRLTEASRKKPDEKSAKLSAEWKSEPPEDKSLDSIFLSGRGYDLFDPFEYCEWVYDNWVDEFPDEAEDEDQGGAAGELRSIRQALREGCGAEVIYKSKHYKRKLEIQVGSYNPPNEFETNGYPIGIFVDGRKVTHTDDFQVAASLVLQQDNHSKEIKKSVLMKIGPYLERKLFERDKKIVKMFELKFDSKGKLK